MGIKTLIQNVLDVFHNSGGGAPFYQLPPLSTHRWTRPAESGDLPDDAIKHIQHTGTCPYCDSPLYEGPRGGMSVNLFCGNEKCDSRFNVAVGLPWGQFTGECPPDFYESLKFQK